jgi:hypothetical protein
VRYLSFTDRAVKQYILRAPWTVVRLRQAVGRFCGSSISLCNQETFKNVGKKKTVYASGAQTRKYHYILQAEDIVSCLLKARIGKPAETAFARERLSSHHIIATTDMHATIKELLEDVFFAVRSCGYFTLQHLDIQSCHKVHMDLWD